MILYQNVIFLDFAYVITIALFKYSFIVLLSLLLTLVNTEYLLKWVHDKSTCDHNCPNTKTGACHVEHEQSNKDLLHW